MKPIISVYIISCTDEVIAVIEDVGLWHVENKKDGAMTNTDILCPVIAPSLMVACSPGCSQQW